MPIYEYTCAECGTRFEKLVRSFTAPSGAECPNCHSQETRKSLSLCCAPSVGRGASAGGSCPPAGG